jgi:hypothetical protein
VISQTSPKLRASASSELPLKTAGQTTQTTDYLALAAVLTLIAVGALWFFHSRNEIMLSGDAVAHINIARRVFDSRTPGLLQLGSVWLPLPHLLTIPFIVNGRMWQSGIGGSIVSVISCIAGGLGMFRLLSKWSRSAAWTGTLFFALNPNVLYVQSTALNEPLYLATSIWTVAFFVEAWRLLRLNEHATAGASLQRAAIMITASVLTRYDGWFLGCLCWAAILPKLVDVLRRYRERHFRVVIYKALLLTALGPGLWVAYNFGVYENALEFANGPYSAKAIAQRTTNNGAPPYPGQNHVLTASTYFIKAAQLNIGDGFSAKLLVFLATLASVACLIRGEWPVVILLWSPLVFYSLSIAYGSVPIFIPVWWPYSYYNTRYGLELLPALAAGIGFFVYWMNKLSKTPRVRVMSTGLVVLVAAVAYMWAAREVPICLRETRANGQARLQVDRRLSEVLKSLPPQSTVLTYTGAHSGAFELAAFSLRRTLNEGNLGIWDVSLADPGKSADYLIASEGDPVSESVRRHPAGLETISVIATKGQPTTIVFKSLLRAQ